MRRWRGDGAAMAWRGVSTCFDVFWLARWQKKRKKRVRIFMKKAIWSRSLFIVCAQNNVAISFCRMPGVNQLTTKQTDAIRQYTGLLCNSPTQVAKARCWGLLLLCQGLQSMYVFMVECTFYDTTARPPLDIDTGIQAIYFRHGRPSF